jgi:2-oxoglutarate/2-oxoacid ferredoxin oxidoreductase subunit beta
MEVREAMQPVLAHEQVVFEKAHTLLDVVSHYCPGCGHGLIHRLVAEVIDELGIRGTTIGVASVGCSVLIYNYLDIDFTEAAHGRAPAMATGIKRVRPDRTVFTYQGDGDLASIGMGEIVHCAGRGEQVTVIFVNNAVYGMTGGQMAPTTLPGQVTTSSPLGRNVAVMGYPLRMCEILSQLDGAAYIVRRSVHDVGNLRKTKSAIKTAFQAQIAGAGFSMVEILSPCPTNWGMSPIDAATWVRETLVPYYPLGDYKVNQPVKAFAKAF